jgi:hypothetical protein
VQKQEIQMTDINLVPLNKESILAVWSELTPDERKLLFTRMGKEGSKELTVQIYSSVAHDLVSVLSVESAEKTDKNARNEVSGRIKNLESKGKTVHQIQEQVLTDFANHPWKVEFVKDLNFKIVF